MDNLDIKNSRAEQALYLSDRFGWSVIPIGTDKKPLIAWKEYQTKRVPIDVITQWFTDFKDANVGVVTGKISNLTVIDIDPRHGGSDKEFSRLITVKTKTGGGGWQYFFQYEDGVGNRTGIQKGIDVRSEAGYVIVPPSIHASGNKYEWVMSPYANTPILPLPDFIKAWIKTSKPTKGGNWNNEVLSGVSEGNRNDTAASVCGKLLARFPRKEWRSEAWPLLQGWNSKNTPPLSESELRSVFESIASRESSSSNITKQSLSPKTSEKRGSIPFAKLEETIKKWLLIKDLGIIKIVVGAVIANRLKADPVWLFIVTASGGTKTELIRGLNEIEGIYALSDLTAQTFLSGEKSNKNASLLLRLPKEVTLTLKDFTTVLTMHRDKRHAILSQLREIYDGYYKKDFGTGESKEWIGKLGFIAGVTPIIDTHYSIYQTLGERFVQYRPLQPDPIKLSLKAMSNSGSEEEMRNEIQDAFANFVTGLEIPKEKIVIADDMKRRIAHLSAFCVRARSGVVRDSYSTRAIELIPEAELPTRLSKQLVTLCSALHLISGGFTTEDYDLIYKVGMDTLPQNRRLAVKCLIASDDYLETADVAMKIGYPTNTTRRILEDLHGLALIDRESKGRGYADRWIMTDLTKELLHNAKPESNSVPEMSDDARSL